MPAREITAHRGKSETRISRNVGEALDLPRGQGCAEFAFPESSGKGGAASGGKPDGFKVFVIGFLFVQQIDGPNLGPRFYEQFLEQCLAEGTDVLFLEHDRGDPGG